MDDQTQELDLLADGELGDDRRRELLSRLEEQPDGWRRCAMAFLEAQDWRREIPRAARESTSVPVDDRTESAEEAAAAPASIMRRPPLGWLGTMLAMAASFVLALGMGVAWRSGWRTEPVGTSVVRPDADDVARDVRPDVGGGRAVASTSDDGPSIAGTTPQSPRHGTVTLAVTGADGQRRLIEVPVLAVDRYDPSLLTSQPAGLSEDLVRQLRRSGHEVEQHRELVPVSLDDGRQLVLPVDQVEVRFVNQGYQ